MENWYVYLLLDPRGLSPKYVGATIVSVASRLNSHISTAKQKKSTAKDKWILELLGLNLRPIVIVLQSGCDSNGWVLAEKQWIYVYDSRRIDILNVSDGGIGCFPRVMTQRRKDKISIGKLNSGYRHSEETRKKISETQTGKTFSYEARLSFKAAQMHRREMEVINETRKPRKVKSKLPIEQRNAIVSNNGRKKSKPVIAIESGEIYPSQKAAALAMNCKDCSIRKAIKTGQRCKGFHWERIS